MRWLPLAFVLVGCQSVVPAKCPTLKVYTLEDQRKLASAVQALPNDSPLVGAMLDYQTVRNQIRACRGGQ